MRIFFVSAYSWGAEVAVGGLRLGDKMVETTDEEVEVEVEDVKETFTISLHQVNS